MNYHVVSCLQKVLYQIDTDLKECISVKYTGSSKRLCNDDGKYSVLHTEPSSDKNSLVYLVTIILSDDKLKNPCYWPQRKMYTFISELVLVVIELGVLIYSVGCWVLKLVISELLLLLVAKTTICKKSNFLQKGDGSRMVLN